jgi:hypothetical protein
MNKDEFITIKKTFFNCLLKLALQKIKYIPIEPLTTLVEYVSEEFIHTFTLLEFSSDTPIEVSNIEFNKHIKRHCKRIIANDYDCSGYLKINDSYIHLNNFSKAIHDIYLWASSIELSSLA